MVTVARKILIVSVLAAVGLSFGLAATAHAADVLRLFGEENAGTAGAQFLRVPVGARAVALGKAFTAMATDAASPYWNAAGIMRTPGRTNYYASHSEYTAGIDLDYLAFHRRGQNYGYGLSMGVLR